eukprot:3616353-Rhodomonas_salina.1
MIRTGQGGAARGPRCARYPSTRLLCAARYPSTRLLHAARYNLQPVVPGTRRQCVSGRHRSITLNGQLPGITLCRPLCAARYSRHSAQACPAGTTSDGSYACTPCPKGHYAPSDGSITYRHSFQPPPLLSPTTSLAPLPFLPPSPHSPLLSRATMEERVAKEKGQKCAVVSVS